MNSPGRTAYPASKAPLPDGYATPLALRAGRGRPDLRVTAVRGDLADIALAGRIFVPHYAVPQARTVTTRAMLMATADASTSAVSELLVGEQFMLLDIVGEWAWGYCAHDDFVGHISLAALAAAASPAMPLPVPDHAVTVGSALCLAAPDIKAPVVARLPMGSRPTGQVSADGWLACPGGFIHPRHFAAAGTQADPVALAAALVGAPYVWGGRGGDGLDCSGLVQMVHGLCGIALPRDSDQQAGVGEALASRDKLMRGDAVFFPGHVGLMVDDQRLIHANAYHMAVTVEPLDTVTARFADPAAAITAMRRYRP